MKRSITLSVCALCALVTMAQDIIVTKDAKRIEAKIQEISSTEIKYKKFTYQDGPLFVLSVAEVNTILFENGDVQVFHEQPTPVQSTPVQTATPQPTLSQPAQTAVGKDGEGNAMVSMIEKQGDFYVLKQGNTSTPMDKAAYLRFIQNNCPAAWQRYQQGTKLWKEGWWLLGAGIGVEMLIGVPLLCAGYSQLYNDVYPIYDDVYHYGIYNSPFNAMFWSGAAFIAIGSLMEAGSIPLLIVGGIRRNNTHEIYNVSCKEQNPVSLNLQSSSAGIGLALRF